MRASRLFALILLLPFSTSATSEDADDWKLIGGKTGIRIREREEQKDGQRRDGEAAEADIDGAQSAGIPEDGIDHAAQGGPQ